MKANIHYWPKSQIYQYCSRRYIISFSRQLATWIFDHSIIRVKYTAKRHVPPSLPRITTRATTIDNIPREPEVYRQISIIASINYRNSDRAVIIIHSAASLSVFIGCVHRMLRLFVAIQSQTDRPCSILLITYDALKIR